MTSDLLTYTAISVSETVPNRYLLNITNKFLQLQIINFQTYLYFFYKRQFLTEISLKPNFFIPPLRFFTQMNENLERVMVAPGMS